MLLPLKVAKPAQLAGGMSQFTVVLLKYLNNAYFWAEFLKSEEEKTASDVMPFPYFNLVITACSGPTVYNLKKKKKKDGNEGRRRQFNSYISLKEE